MGGMCVVVARESARENGYKSRREKGENKSINFKEKLNIYTLLTSTRHYPKIYALVVPFLDLKTTIIFYGSASQRNDFYSKG